MTSGQGAVALETDSHAPSQTAGAFVRQGGSAMTVTDTARAEIEAAIVNANESAKRMHDSPAYWAVCHARIDEWLTELEALDRGQGQVPDA